MAENSKRKVSIGSHNSQEQKKNEYQERKKWILYLILDYLKDHNLQKSYETLKAETQMSDKFVVCDNVDLDIIIQEYQSYYNMKFQREPRIIRLNSIAENSGTNTPQMVKSAGKVRTGSDPRPIKEGTGPSSGTTKDNNFQFNIVPLDTHERTESGTGRRRSSQNSDAEKKPLSDFSGYTQEWREMADQVMKEFVPNTLGYSWEHCIGLEKPVELLKEATVYPVLYPELFQDLTSTWTGVLLYGPPGTGKTLLAKALACECNTNFINVTSSAFVSKWRGDSEKMIKVTFDLAKYYAPTTIFIDEIDALLSENKDSNHEASCRFKSELLIQMDGLLSTDNSVFVLATTNSPWKLDKALLRRFEKRILIPLPNEEAKIQILKHYSKLKNDNRNDLTNLIQLTENFSGSDIKNVCKEAEMSLIREQLGNLSKNKKIGARRKATLEDLVSALKSLKPSTSVEYNGKILDWHNRFGCT